MGTVYTVMHFYGDFGAPLKTFNNIEEAEVFIEDKIRHEYIVSCASEERSLEQFQEEEKDNYVIWDLNVE
jgi:viroplasmin and RNaseH domain-containing protein